MSVLHVLGTVRVKLAPDLVEEVIVFVGNPLCDVIGGLKESKRVGAFPKTLNELGMPYLRVILKDDCDVHVDDDKEGQDQVDHHEKGRGKVAAAVA